MNRGINETKVGSIKTKDRTGDCEMNMNFYMPTKVIMGDNCVRENAELFGKLGTKAMLVTGVSSAKRNGAQADVVAALEANHMEYVVFDKVMANPTIACVYEGAAFAKENNVDLIVAIGGGSPMDAAKAISLLAVQDIKEEHLFDKNYGDKILPMIHIPTTAGTGSEVTEYAILTNDKKETKTSIGSPILFPTVALCDPKYMIHLGKATTINTAIDALSHAIEGMLSVKASSITNALAIDSIKNISSCYEGLKSGNLSLEERSKLLYASTLAGMVIAHTGTTAVHSMGYGLTYFKNIDHGRANGLLLAEFLKLIEADLSDRVEAILEGMKLDSVDELKNWLDSLLGEKEEITEDEIRKYASIAIKAHNIANCPVRVTEKQLIMIYEKSML